jgi:hypothetical protein
MSGDAEGPSGGSDTDRGAMGANPPASTAADQIKLIGGLVALGLGLLTIAVIVIVVALKGPSDSANAIATAGIGIIGSIVGAYFGVKVGSDGTQKAIQGQSDAVKAQQTEATKAQIIALYTPHENAEDVLAAIQKTLPQQATGTDG